MGKATNRRIPASPGSIVRALETPRCTMAPLNMGTKLKTRIFTDKIAPKKVVSPVTKATKKKMREMGGSYFLLSGAGVIVVIVVGAVGGAAAGIGASAPPLTRRIALPHSYTIATARHIKITLMVAAP